MLDLKAASVEVMEPATLTAYLKRVVDVILEDSTGMSHWACGDCSVNWARSRHPVH